jgi:hypothetical protein
MIRNRDISPSMVVALVALVLSLSGTAYAVHGIDGRQLKNRSVTHIKIAKGTLTGTEINMSQLGQVPSSARAVHAAAADSAIAAGHATSAGSAETAGRAATAGQAVTADSATTAGSASTLGGLSPGSFVRGAGSFFTAHIVLNSPTPTSILTVPGLGELTGTFSPKTVLFHMLNATGQYVDRTWEVTSVSDGQAIEPGADLMNVGGTLNETLHVQLAWETGSGPHFVLLTISFFFPGSNVHVLVSGLAN